jgi:hypothetical protein
MVTLLEDGRPACPLKRPLDGQYSCEPETGHLLA